MLAIPDSALAWRLIMMDAYDGYLSFKCRKSEKVRSFEGLEIFDFYLETGKIGLES